LFAEDREETNLQLEGSIGHAEKLAANFRHSARRRNQVLREAVAPRFFVHCLANAGGDGLVIFAAAEQIE
jgi:hypothetical protein